MIDNGKFGPYIRCGKTTRSVPENKNLLELKEAEAIELLKSDPTVIKKLSNDIIVKKGRFNRGDYVTNGEVNVGIPKKINSQDITLDEALELINKKING